MTHLRVRIRILKSCPARAAHEATGTKRFVFTIIKIDLPTAQPASRIDNFPSGTAKNLSHSLGRRFNDRSETQSALPAARGGGEPRRQRRTPASCDLPGEAIGITTAVTQVIAAVDWLAKPTETFFLHRNKKVARIFSAVQSWPGHS